MNVQKISVVQETPERTWMNKLAWSLPLFFLIKGLLWLAIPALYAMYSIN